MDIIYQTEDGLIKISFKLDKNSTCQNFRQVRKEGNRNVTREIPFYNLKLIKIEFKLIKIEFK